MRKVNRLELRQLIMEEYTFAAIAKSAKSNPGKTYAYYDKKAKLLHIIKGEETETIEGVENTEDVQRIARKIGAVGNVYGV